MRLISSTALALLSALVGNAAAGKVVSPVVELSEQNFEEFITGNKVTLVEYFAPWCGHCKSLEPEYKKAAAILQDKDIKLATVNCVDNEKLCNAQGIRGYPTLKVFTDGKGAEYEGPREAQGIVKYMKKQIMPAVSKVKLNELDSLTKEEDVAVVGIFAPGSKEAEEFQKVAEALRNDYTFASVQPGIYMIKKFDENLTKYTGDITAEALTKWAHVESVPLMAEVSPENYPKYRNAGLPMAYLFYEKEAMRTEYGPIVENAAKPFKGKINAVYIDAEKFEAHAKALMLPDKWPGIVIHEMEDDLKYPFTGKINKEEVSRFFQDFADGKLEPTYRSEPVPEKDDEPVKTIVHKNFDSIVMDSGKDVLLELYAPWCGACKRLNPTYEALAKAYAPHSDKVVIAKMDGTTNDLPKSAKIKLVKFPTIVLFKAGKGKEQVEFEDLTDDVGKFVEFISKNGTHKIAAKIPEKKAEEDQADNKDEL